MKIECPRCGGKLRKNGTVKRVVRTKRRESEWITVQRYQCKICGFTFRDLPENVERFKQYEKELIEGVQEGLIDSDILGYEDYPCEMTMRRWRKSGTQK